MVSLFLIVRGIRKRSASSANKIFKILEQTDWTKAAKNWGWNSCAFPFFQDYAIKAEIDLELLPFIFGGPK